MLHVGGREGGRERGMLQVSGGGEREMEGERRPVSFPPHRALAAEPRPLAGAPPPSPLPAPPYPHSLARAPTLLPPSQAKKRYLGLTF
jgi:hypothetical protein